MPSDLVVVTLGTNDLYTLRRKDPLTPEHRQEVEQGIKDLLARLRAASHSADCLIMLP